jgi:murein DD-endopeptidase MepM/ murein hydrolase activator NlpD
VSSRSAKHRRTKRAASRQPARARHRKPSPIANALQNHPGKTAAAVTGAVLIAAAAPAAGHWAGEVGLGQAAVLNHSGTERLGAHAGTGTRSHQPRHASLSANGSSDASRSAKPRAPRHARRQASQSHHTRRGYDNPVRAVNGLIPERIDQGVDFGGSGPIYALGNAVITNASGTDYGWPGGGWITYRLTNGPGKGLTVFLAEDVKPTVSVGQHVNSGTVIANMFNGGAGIETGWATADGSTAESQQPEAGGISGNGPFPTKVGMNFEELLQALGVPAGYGRDFTTSGLLPSRYPSDWAAALKA